MHILFFQAGKKLISIFLLIMHKLNPNEKKQCAQIKKAGVLRVFDSLNGKIGDFF